MKFSMKRERHTSTVGTFLLHLVLSAVMTKPRVTYLGWSHGPWAVCCGFRVQRLCSAGQGVVQFATEKGNSELEFAIKLFVHTEAFCKEAALYQDTSSPFHKLLPSCRSIVANEDGLFVDGRGCPMPPCIVVERGESLDLWAQRSTQGIDPFTCMQVCPSS